MQLSGTGALLVDPKFADSLKCVDASLNARPAGKRQLMVALAKRLREANLVLEAARLLYEARAPPLPADGSGVGALDAIAKEASASLAEMLLESIADGVVATQGGGAAARRRRRPRRRRRRRRRRSAPRRCATTRRSPA